MTTNKKTLLQVCTLSTHLIIAGAMYWNEDTRTYLKAAYTMNARYGEFFEYVPYPWGEEADDLIVEDMYTEEGGGDTYYYDGSGSTAVPIHMLSLVTPVEDLIITVRQSYHQP